MISIKVAHIFCVNSKRRDGEGNRKLKSLWLGIQIIMLSQRQRAGGVGVTLASTSAPARPSRSLPSRINYFIRARVLMFCLC